MEGGLDPAPQAEAFIFLYQRNTVGGGVLRASAELGGDYAIVASVDYTGFWVCFGGGAKKLAKHGARWFHGT